MAATSSIIIIHERLQPPIPSDRTTDLLPENPQRKRQEAHEQEQAAEDAEDIQRAILGEPVVDEVRQTEREQIPRVDGDEGLLVQVLVRVHHVPEHARAGERERHVRQAEGQDGTAPVRLVVHRGAEAEEAHGPEHDDDEDERQAELGLVDAAVPPRERQADVVVQRARDDLAEDGEDEGGQGDQAGLGDGEVVRGLDEDDAVDDAEDDDPRQGRAVDEEAPEDGRVEEEDEGPREDLPHWGIGVPARVDAQGAQV